MTTISGEEFDLDVEGAKHAAMSGPVFITDQGRPTHVLLTIEAYKSLPGLQGSLAELLACPEAEIFDFEPNNLNGTLSEP